MVIRKNITSTPDEFFLLISNFLAFGLRTHMKESGIPSSVSENYFITKHKNKILIIFG